MCKNAILTAVTRLQSHPRHEYHRHPATRLSDEGIVSNQRASPLQRPCVRLSPGVSTQPRPKASLCCVAVIRPESGVKPTCHIAQTTRLTKCDIADYDRFATG